MKHLGSLAIITNPEGKYLLHFRDANAPTAPNTWGLFGGHAEDGETPLETLARELEEELGLRFPPHRFTHLDTYDEEGGKGRVSLYRLSLEGNEEARIRLGEGGGFRFFPSKQEVLGLEMSPPVRELFIKHLGR